jgi:hypothetical protein
MSRYAMIYAVLKQGNDETANLFFRWEDFHKATFNPEVEPICIIELGHVKGNYQDKKAAIEDKAIEYSNNQYPGLSYGELFEIESYFRSYGKRYGLLSEFRENAIC